MRMLPFIPRLSLDPAPGAGTDYLGRLGFRPPGSAIPRILLLEDEAAVCKVLAEALSQSGYAVLTGGSLDEGAQVLDSVGWDRIDLVVTDAHLGRDCAVRHGHAFHALWRRRHPVPPFIFLSGWGEPDPPPETSCQVFGLAKPFAFPVLLSLVRAVLGSGA